MNENQTQPVALITGSGRPRIGNRIAQALGERGYRIALHYHHSEEEAQASLHEFRDLGIEAEAFQADQEKIDEFLEWAVQGEMLSSEDLALLREDQQAIEDVGRGLHVEILNATLGLEAGYRLAIEADNQLAEALGHFDVAEDMWEVWQANGKAGGAS